MSVSSVTLNGSSVVQANPQSPANQLQQRFKELTNSLQSGNLASARKAFSTIQNVLQSSQSGSSTSSKPPVSIQNIENDVGALRQALGSGDLSGALSAYTKLRNDLRIAGQDDASARSISGGATGGSADAGSVTGKKAGIYA